MQWQYEFQSVHSVCVLSAVRRVTAVTKIVVYLSKMHGKTTINIIIIIILVVVIIITIAIIFFYNRAGQLQSTGGPHCYLRTYLRAAIVPTSIQSREGGTELTVRPFFTTNNKLH